MTILLIKEYENLCYCRGFSPSKCNSLPVVIELSEKGLLNTTSFVFGRFLDLVIDLTILVYTSILIVLLSLWI